MKRKLQDWKGTASAEDVVGESHWVAHFMDVLRTGEPQDRPNAAQESLRLCSIDLSC